MKNVVRRYILIFISLTLTVLITMSVCAFIFDPQNVYRKNSFGVRYYSPIYSTVSAVKNFDYDTAIIGSSMVQNFDTDYISDKLNCSPVKLTLGAMTPSELLWLYNRTQEQDRADTYYINIDLHRFASAESVDEDPGRFPDYMYSRGISQFKYLLGFETWFRFIPLDILLSAAKTFSVPLPSSFEASVANSTDYDKMCCWENRFPPGKEKLFDSFLNNESGFNEGTNSDVFPDYLQNMNKFLSELSKSLDPDETLIFFLPPYSSIYWAEKCDENLEALITLRRLISKYAQDRINIKIIDLQSEDYTTDFDSYIDASHCCDTIQKRIEESIVTNNAYADANKIELNSQKIIEFRNDTLKQIDAYKKRAAE